MFLLFPALDSIYIVSVSFLFISFRLFFLCTLILYPNYLYSAYVRCVVSFETGICSLQKRKAVAVN